MSVAETLEDASDEWSNRVRGRLEGEVAVVTGSTSGLGREIAEMFALAGASVVVTGRNRAAGEEVLEGILARGGTAQFVAADLLHEEACQSVIDAAASAWGPVTVLVNNASGRRGSGAHLGTKHADIGRADWDGLIEMNLTVPAVMCRLVIPGMLERGHGSIVNISSRTAERATAGTAAYTSGKGGLNALSRAITADYASAGIRCNVVQPGHIVHPIREAELATEERSKELARHLTRLTTARDVAYATLFLASPEAETISGAVIPIDGGSTVVRADSFG